MTQKAAIVCLEVSKLHACSKCWDATRSAVCALCVAGKSIKKLTEASRSLGAGFGATLLVPQPHKESIYVEAKAKLLLLLPLYLTTTDSLNLLMMMPVKFASIKQMA